MNTPRRLSPIHDALQELGGSWCEINDMPALVMPAEAKNTCLSIADVSFLTRFGVKGAGAATWLENQGIAVPSQANTWCYLPQGGIVARLGRSEFLVEDSLHSAVTPRLVAACEQPPARVYPVLRQDAAIALCGTATNQLLQQTCSINFLALPVAEHPVILTSMIGVAVTIIPLGSEPLYRIWCDGTFGTYVWKTLMAIIAELGGGVVGADTIL